MRKIKNSCTHLHGSVVKKKKEPGFNPVPCPSIVPCLCLLRLPFIPSRFRVPRPFFRQLYGRET